MEPPNNDMGDEGHSAPPNITSSFPIELTTSLNYLLNGYFKNYTLHIGTNLDIDIMVQQLP